MAVFLAMPAIAQDAARIQEIVVEKNSDQVSDDLVKRVSGLTVGGVLSRDNAGKAIRNLWNLGIFEDIRIQQEPVDNGVRVIFRLEVLPAVNEINTVGFDHLKASDVLNSIKLVRNSAIGERRVARLRQQILDMYEEEGYILAQVEFTLTPVEDHPNMVDVTITVDEGEKVKIKSIDIVGNEELDDGDVKDVMETKEDRWYRSGEYNEEVFEEDKNRIVELYKTEGFRDAVVTGDSLYYDEQSEKVNLMVFVNEGDQYTFGTTSFEGNVSFTDEELIAMKQFQAGETFDERKLALTQYEMTVAYNNRGFLETYVNGVQYAHNDTVDVVFDIAEGNTSTIRKVLIEGNTKTKEKVIRREISLIPGENFSREKLDRSRQDIMMLNYFEPNIQLDYVPTEQSDEVDIRIKVNERSTGMASMGAGYSERDKLVGTLSFTNSNLFGNGQSINFSWDMGSRRRSFQVGFTEPWLFDTPTSFSFDVYNIIRSDYTSAFDQQRTRGGYVRFGRRLTWPDDYSRAFVSYRLDDTNYTNPSDYYQDYLVTGKTSSISFIFLRDSRNMPQFATEGTRTSATFEIAGGPLGGDLSYYKYLLNNELYMPVIWNLSLVGRTKIGFLRGYQENMSVPYSERFMPGGTSYDGYVRGYPNRQVCPLLGGEEIGGETMFVNNIELQLPVVENSIVGIAFFDAGNAWRNLSETNPFNLKRSVGLGARIYIPQMGPVGFDVGYGFDKIEGSDKPGGWRTHFQFGNVW